MFPLRETATRPAPRALSIQRDIIGEESLEADVELIALCVDLLRAFGFTAEDVVVRISDREFWIDFLRAHNVPEDRWQEMLQAIDKSEREPREKTAARLGALAEPVFKILDGGGKSEKLERLVAALRRSRAGRVCEDRSRDRARACLLFRRRLRGVRSRRQTARARRRRPLRQFDSTAQRRRRLTARARLCHGRRRSRRS